MVDYDITIKLRLKAVDETNAKRWIIGELLQCGLAPIVDYNIVEIKDVGGIHF